MTNDNAKNTYDKSSVGELIRGNSYVGRGIIIGKSKDGTKAAIGYFIMGRSTNSRNRVFAEVKGGLEIRPFIKDNVSDPSLIIYRPILETKNGVIVTNGDQTDTIWHHLQQGGNFISALDERKFEPDAPNYTPRISGIIDEIKEKFTYQMSILKSLDSNGESCGRFYYKYESVNGMGHFIHTYKGDGNPLPTFCGEPKRVIIPDSIDEFTEDIWENLNEENKISIYTRYIDLKTGEVTNRLINKNKKENTNG